MKKLFLIPFLLFAAVAVASAGCGGCGSKSDDKPAASSECSDSQSDSSAKKSPKTLVRLRVALTKHIISILYYIIYIKLCD